MSCELILSDPSDKADTVCGDCSAIIAAGSIIAGSCLVNSYEPGEVREEIQQRTHDQMWE